MMIQTWKTGLGSWPSRALLSLMASGLISAQAQPQKVAQGRQAATAGSAAALVGTWKLLSVETRMTDGSSHATFGQNPEGYLIYGSDGMMSVNMQWAGRKPFASGIAREASQEEKASVSDLFSGYAGRYEVQEVDSTVIHHIEVSSFPNWNGVQQPRIYQIDGDQLTLYNKLPIANSISYLVWRRVK